MTKQFLIITAIFFLFDIQCMSQDEKKKYSSALSFETAEVYFEQNTTDGDAEVVFKAKAGDDGITTFVVTGPDGRTYIDFKAPETSTLGIRQFQLESPEPPDIEAVKNAYPEGLYKFYGITTNGTEYFSEASLNHTLPPPVTIQHPANEADNVDTKNLEIVWSRVDSVVAYLIEIEQEDSEVKIEATLLNSKTSFLVPEKFLLPNTRYKVVVGSLSENGNLNFVESAFITIAK